MILRIIMKKHGEYYLILKNLKKRIRIPQYQNHNDKGCHNDNPTGKISFFGKLHEYYFGLKVMKK
jgi:hypothetical protein